MAVRLRFSNNVGLAAKMVTGNAKASLLPVVTLAVAPANDTQHSTHATCMKFCNNVGLACCNFVEFLWCSCALAAKHH